MKLRAVIATTATGAFVAASAVAAWMYLLWAFRTPDAQASTRAPRPGQTEVLGLAVGTSARAAIDAAAATRGLRCADVSMKKLMADAVSGASPRARGGAAVAKATHHAPPQLRLACEGVPASILGGERPDAAGRLLFVLDADDAPLRNVSHQRTHADRDAALADLAATIAALTATHGPPTEVRGDATHLERLVPVVRAWHFDGLDVRVSALDHGKRGVAISEELGVPYPAPAATRR